MSPQAQPSQSGLENADILPFRRRTERRQINAARDAARASGVEHEGHVYDTDPDSVLLLTATIASIEAGLALPEGFYWTTADDQDVPHTGASLKALAQVMLNHGFAVHHAARTAKTLLEEAESESAIEAIGL